MTITVITCEEDEKSWRVVDDNVIRRWSVTSNTTDMQYIVPLFMAQTPWQTPNPLGGSSAFLLRYMFPKFEPHSFRVKNSCYVWYAEATYLAWPLLDVGVQTLTMSTTGGTQHILYSRATVGAYPSGAPSYNQAIGVSGNFMRMAVQGVDVIVPVCNFKVRYVMGTKPDFTSLVKNTGCTNMGPVTFTDTRSGEHIFCDTRECLFRGAEVPEPRRQDGAVEVIGDFSAMPNRTGISIGSGTNEISNITKAGWEYMWIMSIPDMIGTSPNERLGPVPKFVYVEQVYPEVDFTELPFRIG